MLAASLTTASFAVPTESSAQSRGTSKKPQVVLRLSLVYFASRSLHGNQSIVELRWNVD